MSQDLLNTTARASRRRLNGSGEPENSAPVHANGNGATEAIFTDADQWGVDKEVAVEWNGKKNLLVRYNANRLSQGDRKRIAALAKESEGDEERDYPWLWLSLAKLMTGWNYVQDPETMETYPITAEALEDRLTLGFGFAILNAIHEDMNPPEPSTSSGNTA